MNNYSVITLMRGLKKNEKALLKIKDYNAIEKVHIKTLNVSMTTMGKWLMKYLVDGKIASNGPLVCNYNILIRSN